LQSPSLIVSSLNVQRTKLSIGFGITLLHAFLIYFFIISKHPHAIEKPSFRSELHFITTPQIAIQSQPNTQQNSRKISTAKIVQQRIQQPAIQTTTTTTQTSSITANDTRITAPDFDQMLEQQKQKKQSSQQLNIDHGQLAKEIETKGQRTLEFAPKASETTLQKLNKGYDRAGPYVEYESKSYTRPDGSRVTKVISNKGTSCMRANRPHDRIDNRGPRVWKVEC
jgi:hypothetical protein